MNSALDQVWRFGALIQWLVCGIILQYTIRMNWSLQDRIFLIRMMMSGAYLFSAPVGQIPQMIVDKMRQQARWAVILIIVMWAIPHLFYS